MIHGLVDYCYNTGISTNNGNNNNNNNNNNNKDNNNNNVNSLKIFASGECSLALRI